MNLKMIYKPFCFLLVLTACWTFGSQPLKGADPDNHLQLKEKPLTEILDEFSEKYQVFFSYDSKSVKGVELEFQFKKGEKFDEAIDRLLTPIGFAYESFGDKFLLVYKNTKSGERKTKKLRKHIKRIQKLEAGGNLSIQPKSKSLRDNVKSIARSLAELKRSTVISGTVTSEEGDPLIGVNILVENTTIGTVTDYDGRYQLEVPDDATALIFSYTGYQSVVEEIEGRTQIDVVMTPNVAILEEVVVVGYGTVKKSDLTGSVSSVRAEELTAYPSLNTVQALQGRAAGVQITSNNGEPGSSYKVRVRGSTSINASSDPIYVVDGFVGGALPPPEDIESIEVLKDASATAIYGSRGANGVVMISTKRGKQGKTRVELNVSHSLQEEINRLDLLNADQFAAYIQETNPSFTPAGQNTDWQEEIFRQGSIQNYQLGISGGSENLNYYLSGTFYDQQGIIINSNYQRFSALSNIDLQASERFRFGLNIFARRTSQDGVRTQEGSGGANGTGVVASAFKFGPDQGIFDANGNYTLARINDKHDNPVAVARERTNENVIDRFQGNVFGEYEIIENLKFKVTLGASTNNGRTGQFTPTTLQGGAGVGGEGSAGGFKNSLLLNENYLSYSKSFGSHNLSVLGGFSYQKSRSESWGGSGQSFVTDAGLFWNLDGSSVWLAPSSGLSEWELASWYGRLNYSFSDKYFVTFNARYDGSSTFSANNKWAFFPSGAVAWNMKNEAFMDGADAITHWKWRVSYGLTGNRAIDPYQTLANFSNVLTIQNGQPVNAVAPTSVANNNLTWETTAQLDVGADIGFFNGRLNLTLDYYRMETSDLLFSLPLPEYSGYNSQLTNIGTVENKGFEFTLNSRNLVGEFKWNMDFNISTNKNKILELPDGNDILYNAGPGHMVGLGDTQILQEGEPVGVFYGFNYLGVYQEGDDFLPGGGFEQEAGGEKFEDINGDGQLNNADRVIIGNPHPDFIFGWNNEFRWKGFDLNVFFTGSQGNDLYSFTLMELDLLAGLNNATTTALDRWTPTHTDTDVPKATTGRSRRASTRFVSDGSFVRLRNISLGYNLPPPLLQKMGLQQLRIYVSGQNLLTFTDYEGYDPEVNYRSSGRTNSNRNLGLDYGSYPNAKSITFGLNVGF
jgi:TonB-linked SusC/RagA family outer membrane protein